MKYLVLVALSMAWGNTAFSYSCQDLANKVKNHLARSGSQTIEMQMTGTKKWTTNKYHVSYSKGQRTTSSAMGDKVFVDLTTTFSDRDRFSSSRSDKQRFTLHSHGRAELMLRTWGNTKLWIEDMVCHEDGLITGHYQESNGKTRINVALRLR